METTARSLFVGLSMIFLSLGLVVFLSWMGEKNWSQDMKRYTIFFNTPVTGLLEGSAVTYQGVPVGTVDAIELDLPKTRRVRVTVSITQALPIQQDTIASLQTQGLTGNSNISLRPGNASNSVMPLPLKQGSPYPVISAEQSHFQNIWESLPHLVEKGLSLMEQASQTFNPQNQQALQRFLAHLDEFGQQLPDLATQTQYFLDNSQKQLSHIHQVLNTWNQSGKKLTTTFDSIHALLKNNETAVNFFLQEGSVKTNLLLSQSTRFIKQLQQTLQHFQQNPLGFLNGQIYPQREFAP